MTKDLIKDYFGISDTEFEKIWHNASKIVEKIMSETENGDDTNSYYNSIRKKYNDGKLVEKSEKEYVNGKCIKDEIFNAEKDLVNDNLNKTIKLKNIKIPGHKLSNLMKENKDYRNQINEMTQYIDELNDKIRRIETEKAKLQSIIDNVKNCF